LTPDEQYRGIYYAIAILILLAVLGYFLADYNWNNIVDNFIVTEVP
jgi:hypothetical protein